MKILWVTRAYPFGDQRGDFIYSSGLLKSIAATGARIHVLCRPSRMNGQELGPDRSMGYENIIWTLIPSSLRRRAASLFSPLPSDAYSLGTRRAKNALRELLAAREWPITIVDFGAMAWSLPILLQYKKENASIIVYISHNFEQNVRRDIARKYEGNTFVKWALLYDAWKYAKLESQLLDAADLVCAITSADQRRYQTAVPTKPTLKLLPGYDWQKDRFKVIKSDRKRRAVILGDFTWIAKQHNLRRFLKIADPVFAEAGVEIRVVGWMPEALVRELKPSLQATKFIGRVEHLAPQLHAARIGIVAEELGGGFKMKSLDYVAHGLPIAALAGTTVDLRLAPGREMFIAQTAEALARVIVANIDDIDRLNSMAQRAYRLCTKTFDWQPQGEALCKALERLARISSHNRHGSSYLN